jgi:hypothetical protein
MNQIECLINEIDTILIQIRTYIKILEKSTI